MSDLQQRFSAGLSIREDNGATYLSGLALPFYDGTANTEYELCEGYFERFAPGSCQWDEVAANLQHESKQLIGLTPDTLTLRETARGIEFDIRLDESSYCRDAKIMVANRKLKGASIEFMPLKIEQKRDGNKNIVYVKQAQISGIGIVRNPAYKATDTYLRELQDNNDKLLMAVYEERLAQLLNKR